MGGACTPMTLAGKRASVNCDASHHCSLVRQLRAFGPSAFGVPATNHAMLMPCRLPLVVSGNSTFSSSAQSSISTCWPLGRANQ